ncbi:hypothetical protein [Streptomyces sp. IBSBF 2394]
MTDKFEWGNTGDPVREDVLHDAEQRIRAVDTAKAGKERIDLSFRAGW